MTNKLLLLYPLFSILYPRLASRAPIHPSIIALFALSTFGRLAPCPTDHLFTSTVHTHAYTYIHRREYVCEYDRARKNATDARMHARSRRQGIARASIASTHRRTRDDDDRDVFHHGARDVPPHDDDDDDDALDDDATGDDRARRRCESR